MKFNFNGLRWRLIVANDGDTADFGNFLDVNVDGKDPGKDFFSSDGIVDGGDSDDGETEDAEDDNDDSDDNDQEDDDFDSDDSDDSDEEDDEDDDDDSDEDEDPDEDDADDSNKDNSQTKLLLELQATNAKLLAALNQMHQEKDKQDKEDNFDDLSDPFEDESFDDLVDVMEWDEDEQKAMKAFLKNAFQFNQTKSITKAQKEIPKIIQSTMTAKQKQEAVRTSFYKNNPELNDVKPYVSQIAASIATEWKTKGKVIDVDQVLTEAAKRAYKNLGIKKNTKRKKSKGKSPGKGKVPAFAKGKGSRKKVSKLSADEKMIQDMINLDL